MLGATAAHRISNGLRNKRKKGDVISGGEERRVTRGESM
jgi:hypothetical protein